MNTDSHRRTAMELPISWITRINWRTAADPQDQRNREFCSRNRCQHAKSASSNRPPPERMTMRRMSTHLTQLGAALALAAGASLAQSRAKTVPVFVNGQAQEVPGFKDAELWIRQELWVETSFDSDGDGRSDRMHVDVTRPRQTDTEGLKVAVVYVSSPYFAGTSGSRKFLWDVKQEVGEEPPPRTSQPAPPFRPVHRVISNDEVSTWVPRGFAVVHSEAPGTGLSQGCPTVGGAPEELAPKAVIDWLNGRAKGYTTRTGNEEVKATWSTGKVGMTGTSYNGTI